MSENRNSPETEYQTWLEERRAAQRSPQGNVALVDYIPVRGETAVPYLDSVANLAEGGIMLSGPNTVHVDGVPLNGETFVPRLRPDGTPLITRDGITVDVFTLDGSDYELRVYDADAASLQNFDTIEAYHYNPDLVIDATFAAYPENQDVPWDFTRSTDTGHSKKVPGVVHVAVDGRDYELVAFLNGPTLVLTFADGTTGKESYAPGRFLALDSPAEDGSLTIDFNRSFIPPCGFSAFYSCPLPPPQNRIAARINAGEKKVVWHVSPYDD